VETVASERVTHPYIVERPGRVDASAPTLTNGHSVFSGNLLGFLDDFSYDCASFYSGCGRPLQDGIVASCAATTATNLSSDAVDWLRRGLAEHASVASFGVESVSLSKYGAPLDLLRRVHEAALDEVHHAELCFQLAVKFGADPELARPGDMDHLGPTVRVATSLQDLVRQTVRAGCVAEADAARRAVKTVAALEAAGDLVDEDVLAAWRVIAFDETRHAELAWDTVRWAVSVCGEECQRIVDAEVNFTE
jgi:hypothetical protein